MSQTGVVTSRPAAAADEDEDTEVAMIIAISNVE